MIFLRSQVIILIYACNRNGGDVTFNFSYYYLSIIYHLHRYRYIKIVCGIWFIILLFISLIYSVTFDRFISVLTIIKLITRNSVTFHDDVCYFLLIPCCGISARHLSDGVRSHFAACRVCADEGCPRC